MVQRPILVATFCAALAAAHPMGNFSVNHYASFETGPRGVAIRYVLDLAEIPAFEMLQQWGPHADPQQKARSSQNSGIGLPETRATISAASVKPPLE